MISNHGWNAIEAKSLFILSKHPLRAVTPSSFLQVHDRWRLIPNQFLIATHDALANSIRQGICSKHSSIWYHGWISRSCTRCSNEKARSNDRALELLSLKPGKTLYQSLKNHARNSWNSSLEITTTKRQQENHHRTRNHNHGHEGQLNDCFKIYVA